MDIQIINLLTQLLTMQDKKIEKINSLSYSNSLSYYKQYNCYLWILTSSWTTSILMVEFIINIKNYVEIFQSFNY